MTSVFFEPLVLPEDILLTPVTDIPAEWRDRIGGGAGDVVISRPGARGTSKRLDAHAAALVHCFRTGRTIVQAVLAFSRAHDLTPERTLEEALPMLHRLIADGLLVPEGSHGAKQPMPSLGQGVLFADYRILRCVQLLDDSELYQARSCTGGFVALKLARPGHEGALGPRLEREAAILRQLDGSVNPELVEVGDASGHPFVAVEWLSGVDAETAAAEARATGDRGQLLRLLTNIARAYSALHRQGIVHGDVHTRNVLVNGDGAVTLIDYGLAELLTEDNHPHQRGGVSFFYEPEWAWAAIRGQAPPKASAAGEQYGVGALLYLLATGHHYLEFNLERETMLRQIVDLTPLRFEEAGVEPWPELEAVLRRALGKRRDQRYPDIGALADALEEIAARPMAARIRDGACATLVGKMLEYLHPEGALYREGLPAGPVCSVNLGAAGIAYAFYRMACARDDPDLLAAADIWISKALRDEKREDAFANPELGMTTEMTGRISLYHSAAGVRLVRALIARAAGNLGELTAALTDFVLESGQPSANRDLTLGRCGTALGCALLLENQGNAAEAPGGELLRTLGRERLVEIWDEVGRFPLLEGCRQWPNLGMAHGWAGLLYTTLRWRAVTGEQLSSQLVDRLAQLRECARPSGRGLSIPWREGAEDDASMPGWCNGSAGLVHLGCLAYQMLGDPADLAFAEGAAWDAWESGGRLADLCCGLAGRAYALLSLHRVSGDAAWLRRATIMAHDAARIATDQRGREHPRHSLYKGELGLTLLLTELERPESTCMPLFEEES